MMPDPDQGLTIINRQLGSGERVLWHGRPAGPKWLERPDAIMLPFSLLWGTIVLSWEAVALANSNIRDTVVFPLFGIPFVVLAIYLLIGRLFVRRWMRSRTVYAVTDQRALSITPALLRSNERLAAVWLASHPKVAKSSSRHGRGTIYIGTFIFSRRWFAGDPSWPGSGWLAGDTVTFANIEDAAHVCDLVRTILHDQTAALARPSGA
jgi:hypothetical protein